MSAQGSAHRTRNDRPARGLVLAEMLLDLTIDGTMMAATATALLWKLALDGRARRQRGRVFEARGSPSVERETPAGGLDSEPSRADQQERSLAQGFFDWSTDTIISNLADNPELGPLVRKLVDEILPELADDPQIAMLIRAQAGAYLVHLQQEPEQVEPLVQVLVGRYLASLREHPEQLTPLVHALGDEYIAYLNEHPERVQGLLQSQGQSLANEVINQVRGRTVTADSFAEMLTRSLLRRPPREQLPEPLPELKARAGYRRSEDGRGPAQRVQDR